MTSGSPGAPLRVVLASASPARRRLLNAAGLDPVIHISDVDEEAILAGLPDLHPLTDVSAATAVCSLAAAKAADVVDHYADTDTVVIGCDSMLMYRDPSSGQYQLSGKPHTPERARQQWGLLRGRQAELVTGHCVIRLRVVGRGPTDSSLYRRQAVGASSTTIRFSDISDEDINTYVATGEPLEVAGAFTLDGVGGWFIDGIDGDPSSVIGLGLPLVRTLLAEVGVPMTRLLDHQNL